MFVIRGDRLTILDWGTAVCNPFISTDVNYVTCVTFVLDGFIPGGWSFVSVVSLSKWRTYFHNKPYSDMRPGCVL